MKETLNEVILSCARELNEDRGRCIRVSLGEDAPLYGGQGALDSLDLVSLVLAVEDAVEARFGVSVTLADERALSRERSPFRTVGSFAEYVDELLSSVST